MPAEPNYIISMSESNDYSSGAEFEFVYCLKFYKKIDHFGPSKDPGGPFFTRTSLKLAPQGPFWGLFGVHEGPGGPLEPW